MIKFFFKKFEFERLRQQREQHRQHLETIFSQLKNNECFISSKDAFRVKPGALMKRNPECKVCDVSHLKILRCNFKKSKIADLLEYLEKESLAKSSDFTLFLDNDIVFEQGEFLDEEEVEDYAAIKN